MLSMSNISAYVSLDASVTLVIKMCHIIENQSG